MNFRIPFKLMSSAHASTVVYPYAISLLESVRTYDSTNEIVSKLNQSKSVASLVAGYRQRIHELLMEVNLIRY